MYKHLLVLLAIFTLLQAEMKLIQNLNESKLQNCIRMIMKKLFNEKQVILYVHDGDDAFKDVYGLEEVKIIWNIYEKESLLLEEKNFYIRSYVILVSYVNMPFVIEKLRNSSYWHWHISQYAIFLVALMDTNGKQKMFLAKHFFDLHVFKAVFIEEIDGVCWLNTYDPTKQSLLNIRNIQDITYRTVFDFLYHMKNCTARAYIYPSFFFSPYLNTDDDHPRGLIVNPLQLWMEKYKCRLHYDTTINDFIKEGKGKMGNDLYMKFIRSTNDISIYVSRWDYGLHFSTTTFFLSHPYVWVVPKAKKISNTRVLALTFTVNVWIYLVLVALLFGTGWWLVRNYYYLNKIHFGSLFIDTLRLILGSCIPRPPKCTLLRIWFATFLLFTFNINYIFQGKYSSFLTVPQYEEKIDNDEKLALSNLNPMIQSLYKNIVLSWENKYAPQLFDKVLFFDKPWNSVYNSVKDPSTIAYYALYYTLDPKKLSKMDYFPNHIMYNLELRYIVVPGSIFLESLDNITQIVSEGGFITKWLTDMKHVVFIKENQGVFGLNLQHVECAFFILICGWLMALLLFVPELILNLSKHTKNNRI